MTKTVEVWIVDPVTNTRSRRVHTDVEVEFVGPFLVVRLYATSMRFIYTASHIAEARVTTVADPATDKEPT